MKEPLMALYVVMLFSTYMRPGEGWRIRGSWLTRPIGSHKSFSLILAPEEEERRSKSGQFDEAVLLDDTDMPWLGKLLYARASQVGTACLWPFTFEMVSKKFVEVAHNLGLTYLEPCLYQLRHGGASHDRCFKKRSNGEVQKRGRWLVSGSMRRYEKHARLQKVLEGSAPSVQEFGLAVKNAFPELFAKRQLL